MIYIQVPDGIYPRPVTNFLMISLLGGMGGVPPTGQKFAHFPHLEKFTSCGNSKPCCES